MPALTSGFSGVSLDMFVRFVIWQSGEAAQILAVDPTGANATGGNGRLLIWADRCPESLNPHRRLPKAI
jgi:hypothetical protein